MAMYLKLWTVSIAFTLVLALVLIVLNAHDEQEATVLNHDELLKPTKFGPIRKYEKGASPHRYRVLALWRATEHSLETCMAAVNTIYPHLQDTRCEDVDKAFKLLTRYVIFNAPRAHSISTDADTATIDTGVRDINETGLGISQRHNTACGRCFQNSCPLLGP